MPNPNEPPTDTLGNLKRFSAAAFGIHAHAHVLAAVSDDADAAVGGLQLFRFAKCDRAEIFMFGFGFAELCAAAKSRVASVVAALVWRKGVV